MSGLKSNNSNHSINKSTLNKEESLDNDANNTADDIDEFMNDDDGGFRYVTVSKEELVEKGKLIAQMHNYPQ